MIITEMRREYDQNEFQNQNHNQNLNSSRNNTPDSQIDVLCNNNQNPNNNDDEYVDIFQVQQLLLDSSSSSHSIPKPKVNLQKAIEYSTHRLQSKLYILFRYN